MYITIIAATDQRGLIGSNGKIPWIGKLPADMARFRKATMGHPVIMGRKTYESIGKPLDGRTNIVLSASGGLRRGGIIPARNKDEALLYALSSPGAENIFVIGGANVYAQFLADAKTLILTVVEGEFTGDTHFPAYEKGDWELTYNRRYEADEENAFPYEFQLFDRR